MWIKYATKLNCVYCRLIHDSVKKRNMKHRQNLESLTFQALLNASKEKFAANKLFGFDNEEMMTYADMHEELEFLKQVLQQKGIRKGDRVALLSHNSPQWAMTYFAITSMGAVIVPLMPDLEKHEIAVILDHSETKLLFVSERLQGKVDIDENSALDHVLVLEAIEGEVVNTTSSFDSVAEVQEDDLAAILYTSGATGNPKAVMLSHKNLITNAIQGDSVQPVNDKDRFLSVLPLSHAYENTLGLLLPVLNGASITYLRKPPTASVLLPALKRVRPTMMLTVPMIIEKIVRQKVFAKFDSGPFMSSLYRFVPVRKALNYLAGKQIKKAFGGELKFFGVGGARLDKKVEQFLLDAKFPYAIGYGLTETAPLAAGCAPSGTKLQSTGPAVRDVDIRISDGSDGANKGEVLIKGPNVMQGYYKNEELSKEVFTEDGYFRSGDIGVLDRKGRLYLKGRFKNMILGANGENIYPEDIESVINNYAFVSESVVVERKGKLVALVHFNREEIEKAVHEWYEDMHERVEARLEELSSELYEFVNARVNRYSRLQAVVVQPYEFEKTATRKIKRFMYA